MHLSGSVVAYEPNNNKKREIVKSTSGQGSLINYQKRQIADAVEWIRLNAVHKPLIFVATSPGYLSAANEKSIISKLTHNLRNGYNVKDYVWVRELTKMGYPHFHFVADAPFIYDLPNFSRTWSSYFDRNDSNSIRLGTDPKKGPRKFYVENSSMAWYLSKYIGKGFGKVSDYLMEAGFTQYNYKKTVRQFAISKRAGMMSQPTTYEQSLHFTQPDDMVMLASGKYVQKPAICVGRSFSDATTGTYFNHRDYIWKQHPLHKVFFGLRKDISDQLNIFKA